MDHLTDRHYDPITQEDAEEERRNFLSVLKAFRYYRYNNLCSERETSAKHGAFIGAQLKSLHMWGRRDGGVLGLSSKSMARASALCVLMENFRP